MLQALHHAPPLHLHEASAIYLSKNEITGKETQVHGKNGHVHYRKGNYSKNMKIRVTVHEFCTLSDGALNLCKVSSKSETVQLTERTLVHGRNGYFQYLQCSKGSNSKGRLTRVMVLVFCMLSHGALHLCEISFLKQFLTYRAHTSIW